MNTKQIVEQDKIQLGEIVSKEQEPSSSCKCTVEVRTYKFSRNPPRKTEKIVKPKRIKTPEI